MCDGYLVDPQNPDPDIVAKNKEDFVTIDGARRFVRTLTLALALTLALDLTLALTLTLHP